MQEVRLRRLRNPATWYLLLGLGLLAASVFTPVATAQRSARVEGRASHIAGLLLEATRGFPTAISSDDLHVVVASFYALAARDGTIISDLETLDPPLPSTLLTMQNKHYLFYLAESPPDERAVASAGSSPAYEVLAWPISAIGPGHSAFFYADNAPRACTRNLVAAYVGTQRPPRPSQTQRRTGTMFESVRAYRSRDEERWSVF